MNRTEQLVTEIVQAAHPKMAVAMRMAAIPHWYDVNLFSAIRAEDDGRNEGIVERLIERYSFVLPIPNASVPTYRIRDEERVVFNTRWIQEDPPGYLVAHKHVYDY